MSTELQESIRPSTEGEDATENGVSFSVERITPAKAEKWMRRVTADRVDPRTVSTYAASIVADAWVMNGQPVIFDEDGRLVDGVQRLAACIEAKTSFTTMVARGVRADTLHTIDQQRRRNYAGVLESRGYRHAGSILRTMSKLVRIENGALGRDALSIGWARYDKVLDDNPEIVDAVQMANNRSGSVLHSTARPVLIYMALRAGRARELRGFLDMLSPQGDSSRREMREMNAGTQARARLSAWNADDSVSIDPDKVLANAIDYFNAWLENDLLPDNHVRNPDPGRIRGADGKWSVPRHVVRRPLVAGLSHTESAVALDPSRGSDALVRRIAGKLMSEGEGVSLTGMEDLRHRLPQIAEKRLRERPAPDNLGMESVRGYPGLRSGRIETGHGPDAPESRIMSELRGAAARKGGDVSVRIVSVTPEMAERWLSAQTNRGNRRIQKGHIEAIARDIVHDRWMVNAQPICFAGDPFAGAGGDPGMRLLNGQHRLHGIVLADRAVEIPVAVNIPESAFATYDVHTKRRVASGSGVDDRVMAAAARLQWKEDNGQALTGGAQPTGAELKETLEIHGPEMEKHFPRSRRPNMTKLGSAGVLTYIFSRVHREDPGIAPDFLDALEYGENLSGKNPVLRLREDMMSRRGRISRREAIEILLDGWTAYRSWRAKTG